MDDKLRQNKVVLGALFLSLELMLFIVADFVNISSILKIIAFLLNLLLIPHFFTKIKEDLPKGLYTLLVPLALFSMASFFAPAYQSMDFVYQNEVFMNLTFIDQIANLLGVISILFLGYYVGKSRIFNSKTVYLVILAGISVPILISYIATIVNYGFFHEIIYAGKVVFFNGQAYSVSNQASFLIGLSIMTVDVSVLINGAIILSSLGLAMLFTTKETSKNIKIVLGAASGLGILTILSLGAFVDLVYLLPAIIFVLVVKFDLFKYLKKKQTLIALAAISFIAVLIFSLTALNAFNLQTIWSGNPLTRKLLMNSYMQKFYYIFKEAITLNNLLGSYQKSIGLTTIFPTGNFLFDSLWIDGLFGFIGLVIFIVLFTIGLVKYYQKSADDKVFKIALVLFLVTTFFRFMLNYPFNQYIYEDYASINHFPLINSPYFLVVVFFAGYMFTTKEVVVGGAEDEKN